MNDNKTLLKKVVFITIFLLISVSILPSAIGNPNSSQDYNLKVYLKPMRSVFPRVYYGNGQPIGFLAGAMNEGPGDSPPFALKFEIFKILSLEPYLYNTTYDFNSQPNGQGSGYVFTWYTLVGFRFGIYEARATINVDDNNTADNTKSYYFIIIRN
jgi:hypothetical protein